MNWKLISEFGYEANAAEPQGVDLRLPSFAACAAEDSLWITDEYGTEKLVPFRLESRSLNLSWAGEIRFDLRSVGIEDGFACPIEAGLVAVLRRTQWELLILNPQGMTIDRIDLSSMSKRMPRRVCWTKRGTFLIVFCNRVGETELVEVGRDGCLLWFLAPTADQIGIAADIEWLVEDRFLIADPYRHVVIEIDRSGTVHWQFGVPGDPSGDNSRVSSPSSARAISGGRRLIADTRNHRILVVDRNGRAQRLDRDEASHDRPQWCDPAFATELDNGHFLICDAGNRRVVETDPRGRTVRQLGHVAPQQRRLSYPRSVERIDQDSFLIADTANNRVVEVGRDRFETRVIDAAPPLFWPRCARPLVTGGLIIADGRNGRILEVGADGQVRHELHQLHYRGGIELQDPHDVHQLPNGRLLISDSAQDLVIEADWDGNVFRVIGDGDPVKLRDPHSAQPIDDGHVLIADTGNHRIIVVGPNGNCVRVIGAVTAPAFVLRLNFPRHVDLREDGVMVIADTGNNRVLASDREGRLIWELSRVANSTIERLNQPRWAKRISAEELVVCDHFHHRILYFRSTTSADPA